MRGVLMADRLSHGAFSGGREMLLSSSSFLLGLFCLHIVFTNAEFSATYVDWIIANVNSHHTLNHQCAGTTSTIANACNTNLALGRFQSTHQCRDDSCAARA